MTEQSRLPGSRLAQNGPVAKSGPPWWHAMKGIALTVGAVVAVLGLAGYRYYSYQYPFGWSHSCDKQLYFALLNYADNHDGLFPDGQATPEACLSLLAADASYPCGGAVLSGKTVDAKIADELLAQGKLLGPSTCDWHYVPGLSTDDGRLALFWDKPGLNHNGGRLPGGGHEVWFIESGRQHIRAEDWAQFEAEQKQLRQGDQSNSPED